MATVMTVAAGMSSGFTEDAMPPASPDAAAVLAVLTTGVAAAPKLNHALGKAFAMAPADGAHRRRQRKAPPTLAARRTTSSGARRVCSVGLGFVPHGVARVRVGSRVDSGLVDFGRVRGPRQREQRGEVHRVHQVIGGEPGGDEVARLRSAPETGDVIHRAAYVSRHQRRAHLPGVFNA